MYNENDCMTLGKISAFMPGAMIVYKNNEAEEIIFASEEIARIFECESVSDFMKFTGGSFATIVYPEDIEEVENNHTQADSFNRRIRLHNLPHNHKERKHQED